MGRRRAEPCPWCAMVRHAWPCPAPRFPLGVVLSHFLSLPTPASQAARVSAFLSPFLDFFFCSLVSYRSFSPSPLAIPHWALSCLGDFRTIRLDIFGLCSFGECMEFLLTWGRRPASHLLTKVPPVIKPPFILPAHTPHSFTSCHFIYCFFFKNGVY